MTSLCDVSMTSSVDVTHHMTCLDMQFMIVMFNLELTTVQYAQASHSHVGVDGACVCKKKWFLKKYVTRQKNAVFPDRPVHWNTPRDIYLPSFLNFKEQYFICIEHFMKKFHYIGLTNNTNNKP